MKEKKLIPKRRFKEFMNDEGVDGQCRCQQYDTVVAYRGHQLDKAVADISRLHAAAVGLDEQGRAVPRSVELPGGGGLRQSVADICYGVGVMVDLSHRYPCPAVHRGDKGHGKPPCLALVVQAHAEGADAVFFGELAQSEHRFERHLAEAPVAVLLSMAHTEHRKQA